MKVLFVHSSNFSYGIEPFIKTQGESLKRKEIILDYHPVKGNGFKGYLKNIKDIKKKAKEYDIIHAHYGLIGLLIKFTFVRKPIVLSLMGSDVNGFYNYSGKRNKRSYLFMFLTFLASISSNVLIVKSKSMLKTIPLKRKIKIIPNGVDFSLFKPVDKESCKRELGIDLEAKVILFLANQLKPVKNYTLAKNAVKKGKNDNLLFLNPYPIKQTEFVKYLNACDVFILTSFNEGSPNVIKEAMACNIPIVSTDVGDVKEIIGNTDGCFITSFDPDDVAQKIQLAVDFGERTTGRKDIKHLDTEIVAQKIIQIYKELL